MASYVCTLRKGVKWYRKLGLELLLGVAVVNAWVVYKCVTKTKLSIRKFREQLVVDLLQIESDKEPPKKRPKKSTTEVHSLLKRIDENGKQVRRKCSLCYSKLSKELGRLDAKKKAKGVFTYCAKCPGSPQFCLDCFNDKHK